MRGNFIQPESPSVVLDLHDQHPAREPADPCSLPGWEFVRSTRAVPLLGGVRGGSLEGRARKRFSSVAGAGAGFMGSFRRRKRALLNGQAHDDFRGVRVAHHICQRFANAQSQLMARRGIQRQRGDFLGKLEASAKPIATQKLGRFLLEKTGQAQHIIASRVDGPYHFAHSLGEVAGAFGRFAEAFLRGRRALGFAADDIQFQGKTCQGRAQIVVQIAGDARAFVSKGLSLFRLQDLPLPVQTVILHGHRQPDRHRDHAHHT